MSNVTVTLNRAHLSARFGRGAENAGRVLAQQIIDDCRPFTPHAEGALEDSARPEKVGDGWAATWNTPYAAYQYYGCWPDGSHVIRQHTTMPNARAATQWAEAAKAQHGKTWERVAMMEFVKGAGG